MAWLLYLVALYVSSGAVSTGLILIEGFVWGVPELEIYEGVLAHAIYCLPPEFVVVGLIVGILCLAFQHLRPVKWLVTRPLALGAVMGVLIAVGGSTHVLLPVVRVWTEFLGVGV